MEKIDEETRNWFMYNTNFDVLVHWYVWIAMPVCGRMKNCFNEILQIAHSSAPP